MPKDKRGVPMELVRNLSSIVYIRNMNVRESGLGTDQTPSNTQVNKIVKNFTKMRGRKRFIRLYFWPVYMKNKMVI